MRLQKRHKIVFIGDSITEDGRFDDPNGLGDGYVRLLRDHLITTYPELQLQIVNKGVGGDRITDLKKRWHRDVIEEHPDWLSISIGINDVWRQIDQPDMNQVYPNTFEKLYRELLYETRQKTNAQLILMEPTVIEEDPGSEGNHRLIPYVNIIKQLTQAFNAVRVPTHQRFQEILQANTGQLLTTDGVHMTSLGRMLMATTWKQAVQEFFR